MITKFDCGDVVKIKNKNTLGMVTMIIVNNNEIIYEVLLEEPIYNMSSVCYDEIRLQLQKKGNKT